MLGLFSFTNRNPNLDKRGYPQAVYGDAVLHGTAHPQVVLSCDGRHRDYRRWSRSRTCFYSCYGPGDAFLAHEASCAGRLLPLRTFAGLIGNLSTPSLWT